MRAEPVKNGDDTAGEQTCKRHGDDTAVGRGVENVVEKAADVCVVGSAFDEAKQSHQEARGDACGCSGEDDEEPEDGRKIRLRQVGLQGRIANWWLHAWWLSGRRLRRGRCGCLLLRGSARRSPCRSR